MVNDILIPSLTLGGIGLVLGGILAVASIVFKVEVDERIPRISEVLPGANCGGCGYAGCNAYAAAIVEDNADISLCCVGGQSVQDAIAEVLGVESGAFIPKRPIVLCGGGCTKAKNKFEYSGIEDCAAADRVGGGFKSCSYGCLGLGNCVRVCDDDAIKIVDEIAVIDYDKCIGCGKCVVACPRNIIYPVPQKNNTSVNCVSRDKGAVVRKNCDVGCIGCKMCEKVCPVNAIIVNGNLAVINYDKCIDCGACAQKCPTKCIEIRSFVHA